MASEITASNLDDMRTGRAKAAASDAALLARRLLDAGLSARLAAETAAANGMPASELKTARVALLRDATARLAALPKPSFDSEFDYISKCIHVSKRISAGT